MSKKKIQKKSPASFTLQPTQDRILVLRIESPRKIGSIFVPDMAREELFEGIVKAAGPGRISEKRKLLPMTLKPGQRILWGKYSGTELEQDGKRLVLLREDEVIAVLEDPSAVDPSIFQVVHLWAGCNHQTELTVCPGRSFQVPLFCEDCRAVSEPTTIERRVDERV